jgi:hypothetical protein
MKKMQALAFAGRTVAASVCSCRRAGSDKPLSQPVPPIRSVRRRLSWVVFMGVAEREVVEGGERMAREEVLRRTGVARQPGAHRQNTNSGS